jgi:hypothetical protein
MLAGTSSWARGDYAEALITSHNSDGNIHGMELRLAGESEAELIQSATAEIPAAPE